MQIGDSTQFMATISQSLLISTTEPLYLDLVDNNDNIAEHTKLDYCDGIYYGSYTVPTTPVRYQLRGWDTFGIPFDHIVSADVVAVTNAADIQFVLYSEVIINPGVTSDVRMFLSNENDGPALLNATISINCTNLTVEYIDRYTLTLLPHQAQDITFKLYGAPDLTIGATTTCTIIATNAVCGASDIDDTNSSTSFIFHAKIKAGLNINATSVTENTISLEWTPSDDIDGSILNYTLTIDFNNGTTTQIILDGDTQFFIISGLVPYQTVYVSISAFYDTGEEAQVIPTAFLTNEAGNDQF